jgi:hypothetical protein
MLQSIVGLPRLFTCRALSLCAGQPESGKRVSVQKIPGLARVAVITLSGCGKFRSSEGNTVQGW